MNKEDPFTRKTIEIPNLEETTAPFPELENDGSYKTPFIQNLSLIISDQEGFMRQIAQTIPRSTESSPVSSIFPQDDGSNTAPIFFGDAADLDITLRGDKPNN